MRGFIAWSRPIIETAKDNSDRKRKRHKRQKEIETRQRQEETQR